MKERLHLVYFHPDKRNGYGACYEDRYPNRIHEQKLDIEKAVVVKDNLTTEEASILERELQTKDGYPLDENPYSFMVNVLVPKAMTPEVQKRKGKTQSIQRKGIQPEHLMTKEARAKAGKKASERQKGKIVPHFVTPEARAKVVAKNTGKKRSQEFKDKLSRIKTGIKIGRVPCKFVPIIATNVKTGEVREFAGQVLAAEELGLTTVNVNNTLTGRQATTGGWSFVYKEINN